MTLAPTQNCLSGVLLFCHPRVGVLYFTAPWRKIDASNRIAVGWNRSSKANQHAGIKPCRCQPFMNLQNIPKNSKYRKLFKPDKDRVFVTVSYPPIEITFGTNDRAKNKTRTKTE